MGRDARTHMRLRHGGENTAMELSSFGTNFQHAIGLFEGLP